MIVYERHLSISMFIDRTSVRTILRKTGKKCGSNNLIIISELKQILVSALYHSNNEQIYEKLYILLCLF